jgi:outer membrane protein TolC
VCGVAEGFSQEHDDQNLGALPKLIAPPEESLLRSDDYKSAYKEHFTNSPNSKPKLTLKNTTGEARLSLREAIGVMLMQNPDLRVERMRPEQALLAAKEAEGKLDPRLMLRAEIDDQNERSGSDVLGSSFNDEQRRLGGGVAKQFSTGTKFSLEYLFQRRSTDAVSAGLSPEWRNTIQATLQQPLLKGTRWGSIAREIQHNEQLYRGAKILYEAKIAEQVLALVQTYWSQRYYRESVDVRKRAIDFAMRVREEAEERVRAGDLAPTDSAEALFLAQLRKEELFKAQFEYEVKRSELQQLIGYDLDNLPDEGIQVADEPRSRVRIFDRKKSLDIALKRRAEIRGYREIIEARTFNSRIQLNRLLPRLDLVLSAATRGISGTVEESEEDFSSLQGTRGDSFSTMFDDDDRGLYAGLEFEYVFGNRLAKSRLAAERLKEFEARQKLRSVTQQIISQVVKANALYASTQDRIKSAHEATALSGDQLEAAEEKLKSGFATVRTVLDVQEDVAQAELVLLKAHTDHEIALAELFFARGELLEQLGVQWSE